MRYKVVAVVRKVGAIGIFESREFTVEAAGDREQAKDAWFHQHGGEWELHHFASITEEGTVDQ